MSSPFGRHPDCTNPDCRAGVVTSRSFGLKDCPSCEALRRIDMQDAKRAVPEEGAPVHERRLRTWAG